MNKQYNKAWFIIDAKLNKESAFESYAEFMNAAGSERVFNSAFKTPNRLYESFIKEKQVKW